jgi:hypothetical protein
VDVKGKQNSRMRADVVREERKKKGDEKKRKIQRRWL